MARGQLKGRTEVGAIGKLKRGLADSIRIRPEVAPAIAERIFGTGEGPAGTNGREGAQHRRNREDRPD